MRRFIGLSAVVLGLAIAGGAAAEYPERPIQFIIAASVGGNADIQARAYLPYLEKCLGKPVIPINRPVQVAGYAEVVKAAPDGYTLSFATNPNFALSIISSADVKYKMDSLEWLGNFYVSNSVLMVRKDSPIQNIEQLVAKLKAKENIKIGISSLTSDDVLLLLSLRRILNVEFRPVPMGGGAATIVGLLGGHVDVIVQGSAVALRHKDEIRSLAIASPERVDYLPDVPTFTEKKMPVVTGTIQPLAAPVGIPAAVKTKLTGCIASIAKNPEFLDGAKKMSSFVAYADAKTVTEAVNGGFNEIKTLIESKPW